MDREFKSKVGWWYRLTLYVLIVATLLVYVRGGSPIAMIALLLVDLFCVHILLSTWYRITADGYLIAHCSIFPEKKIKIEDISAVETSVLPVSSYALSLDRLIIYKEDMQWLLVSPTDKKEFLRCLRKFNPEIKVKEPLIS